MLPLGENERLGRPLPFGHLRAMAVAADEHGLDSVWGADHLLFRDENGTQGIHESWTVLTAVAVVTRRVQVGPLVLALPFRNPALTAKMAAALDEVSGGRLVLGVGCGWHQPEFDAFGYTFSNRVGRFEEAMQILGPMLRTGRADFEGRWHVARDAELLPRGPRDGGPPILIAGKGPRMLRLVARHAEWWNAAWYGHPEQATELAERIARLRAACEAEGRDPATLTLTAGIFVHFPDLEQDEEPPERAISGDPEEVGRAMAGYREHGIEHLIVHCWPRSPAAVEMLAQAAEVARTNAAEAAIP